MNKSVPALSIIGDVGIDLVLGPIDHWPAIGTELVAGMSELRPGGSAGNAALAAHYLGAKCRLLSLIGNDALSTWLTEQFRGIAALLPKCEAPTSVSVGIIHACGERTIFTTRGHLEHLGHEHVRAQLGRAPHRNSIVLLCGAFLTPRLRAVYGTLIEEIRALGYQVALDTGWPSESWGPRLRAEVSQWIARCDHVLLNELEVASLMDCEDIDAACVAASALLRPGATLIVKRGANGASGLQGAVAAVSAAGNAVVVDTIGAGDAFNAGYLIARINGCDLGDSLAAGCRVASGIISRFPRRHIKAGELAHHVALAGARVADA